MKNILRLLFMRLASGVITLWLVITITFFLLHLLPGDPFQSEKALPPKIKANLMAKYNLDKPLHVQYIYYLKNIAKGDLGVSMKNLGQSVNTTIAKSFPVSADVGSRAILFSLVVGIPMGIVAALNRGKKTDSIVMLLALIGISVPSFVLAGLFQRFAVEIYNKTFIEAWHLPLMRLKLTGWDDPSKKILPVLALGLYTLAVIARMMRNKTIEVQGQDYIKLAVAKGLSSRAIVVKHIFRNAISPVVTLMGPTIASILTGSIVIESIFAIPGLGKYYSDSILSRDYTMVLGITVFYAAFLIIMMIVVDILYVLVDPRIRLGKGTDN